MTLPEATVSLINTTPPLLLEARLPPPNPASHAQLTQTSRHFREDLGSFGLGQLKNDLPEEADKRH